MPGRATRPILLLILCLGSYGAAGVGLVPASAQEPVPDPLVADTDEWEEQVAADARGDVLLHWPGTPDLFYLTMGEVFSLSLGESYFFVRVGYNLTGPEDSDIEVPEGSPDPALPSPPPQIDRFPIVTINITFNVSYERNHTISLATDTYGTSWVSNQGRLVVDRGVVDGHREVVYFSPLRRFALQEGDIISQYNVTAARNGRLVDTMDDFDALNDPLFRYVPTHALLGDPTSPPLPLPVPLPPVPPPPVPLPVPVPEPADHVPNDPYPYPPTLPPDETIPNGVPYGLPTPKDLREWDPGREEPFPWDPETFADDPVTALDSGSSWAHEHIVTEGRSRFVARVEKTRVEASLQELGFVNLTVESRFEETDQRVIMLVAGAANNRWGVRYALDMPQGVKDLPAGDTVSMGIIAAPINLFSTPQLDLAFIFLSDWGGFDIAFSTLINMNAPENQGVLPEPEGLPELLLVDHLNPDDPYRVNSPRKLMFQVRDGSDGRFVSGFLAVRADIYPAGSAAQQGQPYQMREKPWMDGVYEITFTFNKPGAWIIELNFFDYPAGSDGTFPSTDFKVRVDHEGKAAPLLPLPLALGSLGLVIAAVVTREKLAKSR